MKGRNLKIKDHEGVFFIDDGSQEIERDQDGYLQTSKKLKKPYRLLVLVTKKIGGKRIYKRKVLKFDKTVSFRTAIRMATEARVEMLKKLAENPEERRKLDEKVEKRLTLDEAFEIHLPKRSLKPHTARDYQSFYDKHVRDEIGYRYLDEIDAYDLQKIIDRFKDKGYKKRTVYKIFEVLNPLFKHFRTLRYIKENPMDFLQRDKKFDNEMEIHLDDNQKRALMKAIKEYPVEPFRSIFVFLSVGRRLSEVLKLEWDHIDLDRRIYVIPKENSKASKEFIFPLTDDLIEALSKQEKRSKFVFPSIKDPEKPMNPGSLKRHWRRVLDTAGIEKFRLHDLRHLLGNTLITNGATLEEIAAVLGHSSTFVTRRYAKMEVEGKRRALEKFKKILEG